jgi:hypothetical protein
MQTIGPPKDNGTLDTILVQAEGKTGDQVERSAALVQSEADYRKQMGQVPEQDHAQKYDGSGWKGA